MSCNHHANDKSSSKLGQILILVMTNLHPGHDKTCTCPRRAHIYCPNDGALLLSDILTHTPSKHATKTFVEYVQLHDQIVPSQPLFLKLILITSFEYFRSPRILFKNCTCYKKATVKVIKKLSLSQKKVKAEGEFLQK